MDNYNAMRNACLSLVCLGLLVLAYGCTSKTEAEVPGPPNIIFLMDDQHRWDALGIVNSRVVTPTLDQLAGNGVFFNQAVCQAPMCIASRNSMMFGLYPNQVGVLRNEPGIPDGELPAQPLAQLFKDAGYETAGFGKTHWGVTSDTRGFDTRYCSEIREDGAIVMIDTDPDKKKAYAEEVKDYGPGEEDPLGYIGRTSGLPEGSHRDGWITEKCLDYLKAREDERPLFLYLSFMKPHAGHNVPAGYEEHYQLDQVSYAVQPPWKEDKSPHAENINRRDLYVNFWKDASEQQWKEMTMRYYANCTWMDAMYGRVLDRLEEKGLLDNALIIYLSDHGEMLGERFYRFNKYCLYEASVRVPVILSGSALPDHFRGKVDSRPAELVDIYPTLLQAAGIEIPEYAAGKDLLGAAELRPASFCALHEREEEAAFMWRTSEYKLILRMNRKSNAASYTMDDIIGGEFYDLERDPREWTDLYDHAGYKKIQSSMTAQLLDHLTTQEKAPPLAATDEP
jgi:arylsulfatase A-like enzyme